MIYPIHRYLVPISFIGSLPFFQDCGCVQSSLTDHSNHNHKVVVGSAMSNPNNPNLHFDLTGAGGRSAVPPRPTMPSPNPMAMHPQAAAAAAAAAASGRPFGTSHAINGPGGVAGTGAGAGAAGVTATAAATRPTGASAGTSSTLASSSKPQQPQQQQQQKQSESQQPTQKQQTEAKEPSDEAILNYLRQRGMSSAVVQLSQILKGEDPSAEPKTTRERMEREDVKSRVQRSLLARTTGGGYGNDRDAGVSIPQWGTPDAHVDPKLYEAKSKAIGLEEAKGLIDAFVALQTWVLGLPDDPANPSTPQQRRVKHLLHPGSMGGEGISVASIVNTIQQNQGGTSSTAATGSATTTAAAADGENKTDKGKNTGAEKDGSTNDQDGKEKKEKPPQDKGMLPDHVQKNLTVLDTDPDTEYYSSFPPSAKPELLAVTFALLVNTYCELLELGMESTADSILTTFRPIYEPLYTKELKDLDKCQTTERITTLNGHNAKHVDGLNKLQAIMVRVAEYQIKRDELANHHLRHPKMNNSDYIRARDRKIAELTHHIEGYQVKYEEIAKQTTAAFGKMQDFPFLRRARVVRWQLTLSASSYALLASYLSSRESLLPINTLLLKQCEVQVERRDPLPYTPAVVLEDNSITSRKRARFEGDIAWAAPFPKGARKDERNIGDSQSETKAMSYPKLHLDEEYDTARDANRAKRQVDFNRSLLMHGFRRLEALERKLEFDSGVRKGETDVDKDNGTDTKMDGDTKQGDSKADSGSVPPNEVVNPLEPSIMLATLCSSSSPGPHLAMGRSVDASAIWEESGVGLTCAVLARQHPALQREVGDE